MIKPGREEGGLGERGSCKRYKPVFQLLRLPATSAGWWCRRKDDETEQQEHEEHIHDKDDVRLAFYSSPGKGDRRCGNREAAPLQPVVDNNVVYGTIGQHTEDEDAVYRVDQWVICWCLACCLNQSDDSEYNTGQERSVALIVVVEWPAVA